jgi:hypothetical protein
MPVPSKRIGRSEALLSIRKGAVDSQLVRDPEALDQASFARPPAAAFFGGGPNVGRSLTSGGCVAVAPFAVQPPGYASPGGCQMRGCGQQASGGIGHSVAPELAWRFPEPDRRSGHRATCSPAGRGRGEAQGAVGTEPSVQLKGELLLCRDVWQGKIDSARFDSVMSIHAMLKPHCRAAASPCSPSVNGHRTGRSCRGN